MLEVAAFVSAPANATEAEVGVANVSVGVSSVLTVKVYVCVADAFTPGAAACVAVMIVVPADAVVITPELSTVATAELELA